MSEQEPRLLRCFASVFAGLSSQELREVSAQSSGVWDSLSAVTLVAVIQDEFDIEINPEALPHLDSFEAFHAYLCRVISPSEQE